MKIAIIGGGISGCTTYLSLKKHLPARCIDSITIYEAYSTPVPPENGNTASSPIIGGGLGLAANGLSVLSRLDPSQSLVSDIVRSGYAISTSSLKTKSGSVLADLDSTSDPRPVPEVFRSESTGTGNEGSMRMHMVASSRHALWNCLRSRVPDEDVVTKRVQRVIPRLDGPNIIKFENGEQQEFDLVIGADGLRSVTRRGMFSKQTQDEDDSQYEYGPHYEGLVGVGGFTPLPASLKNHIKPGTMSLLLSGNGFFGYFPSSSSSSSSESSPSPYTVIPPGDTLMWWSTYEHPSPPPTPSTVSLSSITNDLRTRHANWTDPIVRSILDTLKVTNIYPTWTSPVLPTWEKHGVVLIGDAAHALPSTSGQGASQGIEDAEAFSLFLASQLTREIVGDEEEEAGDVIQTKQAITHAAQMYIDLRRPHVERILQDAKGRQNQKRDVGWVGEMVMYAFMWVMGFFPGILSRLIKQVVNYNVAEEVDKVLKGKGN